MARIYTRAGDGGHTRLFDGTRVRKDAPRVAAYGDVDELNALVGLARSVLGPSGGDLDACLAGVQRDLFALGALLADPRRGAVAVAGGATPGGGPATDDRLALCPRHVERLERGIDAWEAELPPLTAFVLPAGHPAAAALHVARTVARRAERAAVGLLGEDAGLPVTYMNRLSDYLFVAARVANHRHGVPDDPW